MQNHLTGFTSNYLLPCLCGNQNGYIILWALLALIEKGEKEFRMLNVLEVQY